MTPAAVPAVAPAVSVRGLTVRHDSRKPPVVAVDNVTLDITAGETLAIIGESGSGKSTLLRAIAGLHPPAAGTVTARGSGAGAHPHMVFQDPDLALNPRQPVWKLVTEAAHPRRLRIPPALRAGALPLLAEVGLGPEMADRKPHELSGGQRQRVTIARALASRATLILLDEPVSAQDVSLQGSLLRLLARLQRERQLTYLIVSHDVAAVAAVAGRVGVMYAGRLVEIGTAAHVLTGPRHPYTRALIAAVPRVTADPPAARPAGLPGEPPDLRRLPGGCRFRTRCTFAIGRCAREEPVLDGPGDHQAACHRQADVAGAAGTAPADASQGGGADLPRPGRSADDLERGGSETHNRR